MFLDEVNFVVDDDDDDTEYMAAQNNEAVESKAKNLKSLRNFNFLKLQSVIFFIFLDDEDIMNIGAEETLLMNEPDMSSYGYKVAPGENSIPIPLNRDLDAERMSFPTIYGGQEIEKSELYRYLQVRIKTLRPSMC